MPILRNKFGHKFVCLHIFNTGDNLFFFCFFFCFEPADYIIGEEKKTKVGSAFLISLLCIL